MKSIKEFFDGNKKIAGIPRKSSFSPPFIDLFGVPGESFLRISASSPHRLKHSQPECMLMSFGLVCLWQTCSQLLPINVDFQHKSASVTMKFSRALADDGVQTILAHWVQGDQVCMHNFPFFKVLLEAELNLHFILKRENLPQPVLVENV